jgi:hypothetical protein
MSSDFQQLFVVDPQPRESAGYGSSDGPQRSLRAVLGNADRLRSCSLYRHGGFTTEDQARRRITEWSSRTVNVVWALFNLVVGNGIPALYDNHGASTCGPHSCARVPSVGKPPNGAKAQVDSARGPAYATPDKCGTGSTTVLPKIAVALSNTIE